MKARSSSPQKPSLVLVEKSKESLDFAQSYSFNQYGKQEKQCSKTATKGPSIMVFHKQLNTRIS